MIDTAARRVVERCHLETDDRVLLVRPLGLAVIVETERLWWRVERVEASGSGSGAYELYEVRLYISADPPPMPDGAALLPDGSVFCLGCRNQFRAFARAVHHALQPLELADLLVSYQGQEEEPGSGQTLVAGRDDLAGVLVEAQIRAVQGLGPPRVARGDDGSLTMEFWSYSFAEDPGKGGTRIGLNRWNVEMDKDGRLEWAVRSVARGLEGPRY